MHGHNVDSSKPKDFKKSMSKFIRYCKPYFLAISISLIISMLSAILTIIGPDRLKVMANVISDGIKDGIDLNKVKIIAISLVLIYLASAVFGYLGEIIMATVTNKFSKVLRRDITKKINKMPLSYFDKHAYGDILSRITNDVDTLGQGLNQSLSTIVASLTLLLGSILMMFITNYIMAITAIVSSLFGFLFMGIVISKSQKYFDLLQKELGNLNGHIEEVYSGHNVVRVYNGVNKANEEFDIINKSLAENVQKSQFLSELMHPFMGFIGNFSYVCVCIVGSILAIKGIISFGVIVAFIMYVRLFNQPLSRLAQSATSLQSCAAASERVFEFLDEEEMSSERNVTKKLDKNKVKGEIEFKHVKFSYDNEKEVIKDFNAKVKPGEKIAIVGPTGAGKTTMVNLLMKFYDIKEGDILIDGISTKELSRENIHDLFIMVLQDTWVFEGTIKENVRYNSKGITDKDIIDTCKTVGLHHFIKTLPDGYDTLLTDNETLSSGQKQLLTIARGLLEKAPFLILDEATSSVDTRTEELVSKAMDKLMEGRTSFIIAHRLSTIKNADLILMMNEGNIVEVGTHKELLKLNGRYAELYNSQFEKIEDI
jgi:ATP-binding cassette subfamily B protein